MIMRIQFAGAAERRRELVDALAGITGNRAQYLGAPRFDYRVGDFIVHKDGSVETEARTTTLQDTVDALAALGFARLDDGTRVADAIVPDEESATEGETEMPEGISLATETAVADDNTRGEESNMTEASVEASPAGESATCMRATNVDGITLSFPRADLSDIAIDNLKKLIAAKSKLIQMALEIDAAPVEISDEAISFPWLPGTSPSEMVEATSRFLAALIKLAKKLKRSTVVERETDNPRYTFRCFLLRLGFIGDEYKTARKFLMKGLPGNGSARHIETDEPAAPENQMHAEPDEISSPSSEEAME